MDWVAIRFITSFSLAGTRVWPSQRIHLVTQTGWTLGLDPANRFTLPLNGRPHDQYGHNNFSTSFKQTGHKLGTAKGFISSFNQAGHCAGAAKRFFRLSMGLAFWIWQPIHSSIQSFLAPAVFIYPRPFTSCVAIKCLDRRLNSSFPLYSRPMRPIPNHNSLRGRSQFTAWPMRPILDHNCHGAGAF